MRFRSYRTQLSLYTILLMVFLFVTLYFFQGHIKNILLSESNTHLSQLADLIRYQINSEKYELNRYAEIVSNDLRIKEYLYVTVELGNDSAALNSLFEQLYGWLPIHNHQILDKNGKQLSSHTHIEVNNDKNTIKLLAKRPIYYRNQLLGYFVLQKYLDETWYIDHRASSNCEFIVESDGAILFTTIEKLADNKINVINNRELELQDFNFQFTKINLNNIFDNVNLWVGQPNDKLIEKTEQYREIALYIIIIGGGSIFLIGILILKSFNDVINKLIKLTKEISTGNLPEIGKSEIKNEFDILANHFSDMIGSLREKQREIDITQSKLEEMAITDTLTGLYNRRYLEEIFPKLISQISRDNKHCLGVILIDIDHFKIINDTHGHNTGDQCLIHFTEILASSTRSNDFLFRIGGEEFVVLTLSEDSEGILNLAEKLRRATQETPCVANNTDIPMTLSAGVCCLNDNPSKSDSLTELLTVVDNLLYQAKSDGRNTIRYCDDLN